MLKLQGLSDSTIDVYARAVRRVTNHFDCCPGKLSPEQLEIYFGQLVDSHSWSIVKVDRNGLKKKERGQKKESKNKGVRSKAPVKAGKDRRVKVPV